MDLEWIPDAAFFVSIIGGAVMFLVGRDDVVILSTLLMGSAIYMRR